MSDHEEILCKLNHIIEHLHHQDDLICIIACAVVGDHKDNLALVDATAKLKGHTDSLANAVAGADQKN